MHINNLIVGGGAMKGAFAAGVLYEFGENNISFDKFIGQSVGTGILAFYAFGSSHSVKEIFLRDVTGGKFIRGLNYNLEYLVDEVFEKKHKLSQKMPKDKNRFFYTNVTDSAGNNLLVDMTATPYFNKILKATKSLPFLQPKIKLGQNHYFDGCCSNFETDFLKGSTLVIHNSSNSNGVFSKIINFIFKIKPLKIGSDYEIRPDFEYIGPLTDKKDLVEKQFEHGREKASEFLRSLKSSI